MKRGDRLNWEDRDTAVLLLVEKETESEGMSLQDYYIDNRKLYLGNRDVLTGEINMVPYSQEGGIVIGIDCIQGTCHNIEEPYPCFCYKKVVELIFKNGRVIAVIDHGKGMYRIRKNIELGLRSLENKRDGKIIRRFLKKSFVRNYKKQL